MANELGPDVTTKFGLSIGIIPSGDQPIRPPESYELAHGSWTFPAPPISVWILTIDLGLPAAASIPGTDDHDDHDSGCVANWP